MIRNLMDHWSDLLQTKSHDQISDGSLVRFITNQFSWSDIWWIIDQIYYTLVLMITYLVDHWSGSLQTSSADQISDGSLVRFITNQFSWSDIWWIIGQTYYKPVLMISYLMNHSSGLLQTSSHDWFIRYLMDHWSDLLQTSSHDQISDGSLVRLITI